MRSKQIEDEPKVFALIFETGDEIASALQQFSKNQSLAGSSFKAIGALSYVKLGWFNWETRNYDPACIFHEQLELLSLIGDITLIVLGHTPRRWYHERVLRPTATTSLANSLGVFKVRDLSDGPGVSRRKHRQGFGTVELQMQRHKG